MLNSKKSSTPVSERKKEEEQNTGKKLVQARLPFKILAGTPPPVGTSTPIVDKATRKRKLSNSNANRSNIESPSSKENVSKLAANSPCPEVVILSDDDSQGEQGKLAESPRTAGTPKTGTSSGTEKTASPKLQIKLPLTSKRKRSRHASHLKKTHSNEVSECEDVSDVTSDVSKRIKLSESSPTDSLDNISTNEKDSTENNERTHEETESSVVTKLEESDSTDKKEETCNEELPVASVSISTSESVEPVKLDKDEIPDITKSDETPESTEVETESKEVSPEVSLIDVNEDSSKKDQEDNQKETRNDKVKKLEKQNAAKAREQERRLSKQQEERKNRELQRKKEREERIEKKRREREEREEQRRKEKDEKDRKRLAEVEARNEEKRKKEEAREVERRKKEDERRRKEFEKEEEENKKKKAAQAFTKFFVAKLPNARGDCDQEFKNNEKDADLLAFRPFQVKGDMKLAPTVRRQLTVDLRERIDGFLNDSHTNCNELYIDELKNGKHIPLEGSRTIIKENDDDVIVIENELETAAQSIDEMRPKAIEKFKAKFYSFHENRRPPYYGTWRKKSSVIRPRRPFAVDKVLFDYEVDSDDEWEEEEPGESLNGSEDEKDESEDDDYEVDNEWFVPHGHLSDEELQTEDEFNSNKSREAQKAKLIVLQKEFAQEMKKKTEKIKPRLVGAIWEDENGNRPSNCPIIIWDALCSRSMLMCDLPLVRDNVVKETQVSTSPQEKLKKFEINDELMSDLIRLVHGNRHSKVFLIKEYMEHVFRTCEAVKSGECLAPTKAMIRDKIEEISEWSVVDARNAKKKNKKKLCWVVAGDILDKYSLGKLGLHNEWSYKLQPKFHNDKKDLCAIAGTETENTDKSEIHKLSKYIELKGSPSHKKRNDTPESSDSINTTKSTPTPDASKQTISENHDTKSPSTKKPTEKKKVALLMSVAPGEQFCSQTKNSLISSFLSKNKTSTVTAPSSPPTTNENKDTCEVTVLD